MSKPLTLPTLLVVAEQPAVRVWIKKQLEDRFFIISAETEKEALRSLETRLDFIIVDSALEEADPLELCKKIRRLSQKQGTPLFLITGRLKKSYREKAYRAGVTDFLSNQLDPEELQMRIESGEKTASAREKTTDAVKLFQTAPILSPKSSLKDKFVLDDRGLTLLNEAKEKQESIALLVFQIDQFDRLERPVLISKQFAPFLQTLVGPKDLLLPAAEGKWILLLWKNDPEEGRRAAEKLRGAIALHPFGNEEKKEFLTVSIAISSLEPNGPGPSSMIDSAIKAFKAHSDANLIIPLEPESP